MPLEKEIATYDRHLPEFRDHESKFVLIHDADVIDFFQTYEDALKKGYQRFGLEPFLVKQVHAIRSPEFVSRFVALGSDVATAERPVLG